MKNLDDVTAAIKIEIRNKIIGQVFKYRGQDKQITKFNRFWGPGLKFVEDFRLEMVPVDGPLEVHYQFSCWVIQDIDGNSKRQAQIDGHFGPIIISFNGDKYEIDTSNSDFSRIQVS